MRPTGYPDSQGGRTIVQCVNRQITITAPTSVTTGTWDCHIFNTPFLRGGNNASSNRLAPFVSSTQAQALQAALPIPGNMSLSGTALPSGFLLALSVPTGTATLPTSASVSGGYDPYGAGNQVNYIDLGDTLSGSTRVVGAGFEVHNTTPELYVSGACTAYRQALNLTAGRSGFHGATRTASAAGTTITPDQVPIMPSSTLPSGTVLQAIPTAAWWGQLAPSTISQATQITNSVTMEARDGAYVVLTTAKEANPLASSSTEPAVLANLDGDESVSNFDIVGLCQRASNSWTTTASGSTTNVWNGGGSAPLNMLANVATSGAYFTGLSPQTVLTVYLRVYLEMAPSSSSPLLLSLAAPTPGHDPFALQVYSEIIQSMPPACKVGDNPDGEWWDKILSLSSKVLPMISAPLNMAVPGLGSAAAFFGRRAEESLGRRLEERANRPARAPTARQFVQEARALRQGALRQARPQVQQARPRRGTSNAPPTPAPPMSNNRIRNDRNGNPRNARGQLLIGAR